MTHGIKGLGEVYHDNSSGLTPLHGRQYETEQRSKSQVSGMVGSKPILIFI